MKVTVIGLGPGAGQDLTGRARAALETCDLIVGYTAYVELIRPEFTEYGEILLRMASKVDRCQITIQRTAC